MGALSIQRHADPAVGREGHPVLLSFEPPLASPSRLFLQKSLGRNRQQKRGYRHGSDGVTNFACGHHGVGPPFLFYLALFIWH